MKSQSFQEIEAARAREKCRRCCYFAALDKICRLRREKTDSRQRRKGCYRFTPDLWGGIA